MHKKYVTLKFALFVLLAHVHHTCALNYTGPSFTYTGPRLNNPILYNSPKNDPVGTINEALYFNTGGSPAYAKPVTVIANYSSVPLSITNNTNLGGVAHLNTNLTVNWNRGIDQYDGTAIPVPSGALVGITTAQGKQANRMVWEYHYPNYSAGSTSYKGGSSGWKGYPIVNHKGRNTPINKPGYWIFNDSGVSWSAI